MTEIQIILTLPLFNLVGSTPEYTRGFIDATLAPIHQAVDEGVLNVRDMLDAGWELDIPAVA